MKKKTKCKLVLLFVFIFIFCMNVNAATTIIVDDNVISTEDHVSKLVTNKGDLAVNKVGRNDAFSAYKILDTYYNSVSNEISYQFTNDFKAFLASTNSNLTVEDYKKLTSGDITNGSTTTASTLDVLVSKYAAYIKKNSVTGTAMILEEYEVDPVYSVAKANLSAGSYLVLPIHTMYVYAVMVGNIEFKATNGTWELNNATIVAKAEEPGIQKNFYSAPRSVSSTRSFSVGQDIEYTIYAIAPIYPTNATNKIYTVTDTLPVGLTLDVDSIFIEGTKVVDGKVVNEDGNTLAIVTIDGQKLIIDFNLSYTSETWLSIFYIARLNENATLGVEGNTNKAVVTYSNDPYGEGTVTDEDSNIAYTYGIEVFKYTGTEKTPLSGAEFKIYTDSELTNEVGSITTLESGIGQFKGLAEGTYYLKETKAPAGYRLSKDVIEVTIDSVENASGYARVEIPNQEAGFLPVTGSIGTIAFTLVGVAIVGISVYYFTIYRKNIELFRK